MLRNEVAELIKESKSFTKELEGKEMKLDECKHLVELIAQISAASDVVMQVEEQIGGSNLTKSLESIAEMTTALANLPSAHSEVGDGVVCKTLRKEGSLLVSRFHTRLRRLFHQCVVVEKGHIFILKELKDVVLDEGALLDSPIALSSILDTIVKVGNAGDVLRDVLLDVWTLVVRPLWKERKIMAPRIHSSSDSDRAELIYESIVKDSSNGTGDGNNSRLYSLLPLLTGNTFHEQQPLRARCPSLNCWSTWAMFCLLLLVNFFARILRCTEKIYSLDIAALILTFLSLYRPSLLQRIFCRHLLK